MLARTGLGDHPCFAHSLRQQGLPDHVIDLVTTGVRQILPLKPEIDAEFFAESMTPRQRRRTSCIVTQDGSIFVLESGVAPSVSEGLLELDTSRHQWFGYELPAE